MKKILILFMLLFMVGVVSAGTANLVDYYGVLVNNGSVVDASSSDFYWISGSEHLSINLGSFVLFNDTCDNYASQTSTTIGVNSTELSYCYYNVTGGFGYNFTAVSQDSGTTTDITADWIPSAIEITNCTEFDNIDNNLTLDYTLMNDIDCSGQLFNGIAGDFAGTFDGQGYTISNIVMNSSSSDTDDGIFEGLTGSGNIINVSIKNVDLTLSALCGGVVSYTKNSHTGSIQNVFINGTLDGTSCSYVGSVVGIIESDNILINQVHSNMDVTCGVYSDIDACAGFIGVDNNNGLSIINNSYYDGTLTNTDASDFVIGFIGNPNQPNLSVLNSYSNARLLGNGTKYGLFGSYYTSGNINNTYFNSDESKANTTLATSACIPSSCGTALNNTEMQTQANFTGFDFTNIWYMDTYPALRVFQDVVTCSICTETCSPCGGGCTATDLSDMYLSYLFSTDTASIGDITGWDTSCVTSMANMFAFGDFDQNISGWNVSGVDNFSGMFENNSDFNGSIGAWDVSSGTDFSRMFYNSIGFNSNVSDWDMSSATDISDMFNGATSFSGDVSSWNTSSVTDSSGVFDGATSFDGDISGWDTGSITDMSGMFAGSTSIGDISGWDVSSVIDMSNMFNGADTFDIDITGWDVSHVTDFSYMFYGATIFNQDISGWNVSSGQTMEGMFGYATSFDQDLGSWEIGSVTTMFEMFIGAGVSPTNYDSLLSGWSSIPVQPNVDFYAGSPTYTDAVSRAILTNATNNWNITDGGLVVNIAPNITDFIPVNTNYTTYLGDTLNFQVNASDLDNDTLYYSWFEDSVLVSGENESTYSWVSTLEDLGETNITAKINDSTESVQNEWNVTLEYYPISLFYTNIADIDVTTIKVDFNTNADSVQIYVDGVLRKETSLITYTIEGLSPNTEYDILVVPIKDGFYGEPDSYTETTLNATGVAPVMIASLISPATAYTDTTLTGSCRANDIDSADIYYTYAWYVNGTSVKTGTTTTTSRNVVKGIGTLDYSNYVKNQNVTLSCTAHDGILSSSTINTTTTILNSQAEISSIFLIQVNATDYICNHTYIDADNDPQITPSYEWYQNGVPTGTNTISKAIADYNTSDQVFCQVTTGDGIADNVTANSSTYVVGDVGVPTMEVTEIELTAYTDTAMYLETTCTDDVGVASGFPVIRFTNPNLEAKAYSFLPQSGDTYYRYLTFPIAGTYTNVVVQCCDGNSNCVNESRYDIVASVRESVVVVGGGAGGAGGATDTEPFRDITSFEVIPESANYNLAQGARTIGQIQIKNTDIVPIRFSVYIIRDNETPEVYDWMEFDQGRKSDTFTLSSAGGLVTSDRYLSYYINVPEDAPVGQYRGVIEVSGLDQTGQMIINIQVRESGLNLLGFLDTELFTLPTSSNRITGDVIGGEMGTGRPVTLGALLLAILLIIGAYFGIRYIVRKAR